MVLRPIISAFEIKVAEARERTALEFDGRYVSYGELNDKALALATTLASSGMEPEEPVLIVADRSPEFIVAVLAVLHAGGSYVPIDSRSPLARISKIVELLDIRRALSITGLSNLLPLTLNVLLLDSESSSSAAHSEEPSRGVLVGDLPEGQAPERAYVMFTSGSTGEPKGVEITDEAIVNLATKQEFFCPTPDDAFILGSSLAFDAVTFEMWGALLNGARLVIPTERAVRDPLELVSLIESAGGTICLLYTSDADD